MFTISNPQVIVVICCGTAVTISLLRITEKNHSPSPDQGLGLTNGFAEYKDGDLGTRIRGTGSTKGHPGQNEGRAGCDDCGDDSSSSVLTSEKETTTADVDLAPKSDGESANQDEGGTDHGEGGSKGNSVDDTEEGVTGDAAPSKRIGAGRYTKEGAGNVEVGSDQSSRDGGGEPEPLDTEQTKRELNDLVAQSVARVEGRRSNVAFVKTHKTGSTTLASVIYRYGLRHGLKVARFDVEGTAVTLEHAAEKTRNRGKRVDVFHYHVVWDGFLRMEWRKARSLFEEIMAEPASSINYVTVLRDPVQHWLSYYYFYFQPEMKVDVKEYFAGGGRQRRPLENPLAAEFGIYTKQDLDDFVLNHLPSFTLTMLTEDVDESLVLLGKILGWDPIDLTYASLLKTGANGSVRWDGKAVQKAPKPEDLDEDTLAGLALVTELDAELYHAARDHYDRIKAEYSAGLDDAVRNFRDLQSKMLRYLDTVPRNSSAREWYMPESDYYFYSADKNKWWEEDYPPAVEF